MSQLACSHVRHLWYPGASESEHLKYPKIWWIINALIQSMVIHSRQDIIHRQIMWRWKSVKTFGWIIVLVTVGLSPDPHFSLICPIYANSHLIALNIKCVFIMDVKYLVLLPCLLLSPAVKSVCCNLSESNGKRCVSEFAQ